MHRESVASMLLDSDCAYLKKLVAMFGDLEDLEDEDNLKVHVLREEDICVYLILFLCSVTHGWLFGLFVYSSMISPHIFSPISLFFPSNR
jgi:hypothetical protein